MIRAIVGANWGDEGKGKMTDYFAKDADIVVRFQGGSNAGHTIINEYGKFALHLLPSGVFNPNTVNVLGNGVALNIDDLRDEVEALRTKAGIEPSIYVSDRAQVLLPQHILLDTYEEDRLADRKQGSTKSGISPFYADKYGRVGIQVWQLTDDPGLPELIGNLCLKANILFEHLYHKEPIDPMKLLEKLKSWAEWLRPYIKDTSAYLRAANAAGKTILMEGQLGTLRDIDHGIYPFSTSSPTLAGYATVGAGIPPRAIGEIVAVTKAYSSSVGGGPFATELFGDVADELRKRGGDAGEYGAKTGRPRRVGMFDAVATRYGCALQGAASVAMTGIDVLGYLPEIQVCVGYEIDGECTRDFPYTAKIYRAKPIYETLPGWNCDIRGERNYSKLPENAKNYVRFIEKQIETPIRYLSTGPEREALIEL